MKPDTIFTLLVLGAIILWHVQDARAEMENEADNLHNRLIGVTTQLENLKDETAKNSYELQNPDKWATPPPTPKRGCEQYRELVELYQWDAEIALKVMFEESSCIQDRVGDTHITYQLDGKTYGMSCGLMQIRYLPGRPGCIKNPEQNIAYAYHLYEKNGWQPWSVCHNGQVDCGLK